jgi:arylsulfatase A-like enzyme
MKTFLLLIICGFASLRAATRPNIILVMTDDQGWGETSYNGHPILKTPNLDAMAENGLRLDRFYAAPNCSPARASILTGRSNDRTTVLNHGHALRRQEKVLPTALKKAGYATGHFGKWHLNGYSGPGVPILRDDSHHPGVFGFDYWYSVTNFFELNPLMSRNGEFEDVKGDSSDIIVNEALKFIEEKSKAEQPFFTVIWYGSPHLPWRALEKDKAAFKDLTPSSAEHYGELVAMDRSIGTLRAGLRKLDIHENTIIWFNSDN